MLTLEHTLGDRVSQGYAIGAPMILSIAGFPDTNWDEYLQTRFYAADLTLALAQIQRALPAGTPGQEARLAWTAVRRTVAQAEQEPILQAQSSGRRADTLAFHDIVAVLDGALPHDATIVSDAGSLLDTRTIAVIPAASAARIMPATTPMSSGACSRSMKAPSKPAIAINSMMTGSAKLPV